MKKKLGGDRQSEGNRNKKSYGVSEHFLSGPDFLGERLRVSSKVGLIFWVKGLELGGKKMREEKKDDFAV